MLFLSLGSNIGNRERALERATQLINMLIGTVVRRSSFYYTAPWGFFSKNEFVNACVGVETSLTPHRVLDAIQLIEHIMGRTEKSVNRLYHDRVIDIDILLYDDLHVDEPDLKIPHPLMLERDFVMKPLREICNDF
ncbi:MAG: 2-amino-4-hydroxy-6-hydroxymethyldihydropteridine diphosphokinase [Prevotella sp.]|nr:2-amino-4-hydroxy-6-hydroxymethyldihydropteridine diphosphokinase [Prevotella sp.]